MSGNASNGIELRTSNNVVQGNVIGLAADGATDLGNAGDGIRIHGGIGSIPGATGNMIGGTTAAARNVVSGNTGHGIFLLDASNNTVQGNYAGTNAAGAAGVPSVDGIAIEGGSNNTIGGVTAGAATSPRGTRTRGFRSSPASRRVPSRTRTSSGQPDRHERGRNERRRERWGRHPPLVGDEHDPGRHDRG